MILNICKCNTIYIHARRTHHIYFPFDEIKCYKEKLQNGYPILCKNYFYFLIKGIYSRIELFPNNTIALFILMNFFQK